MKQKRRFSSLNSNKKIMPFSFVLEALSKIDPITKPMFGCLAIYNKDKIVLILRDKLDHVSDNGVWLATTIEYHESLAKEFPAMRSIEMFGPGVTGWQNLPADSETFEESVLHACELVLNGDIRIGKIPKSRLKKKTKVKAKRKNTRSSKVGSRRKKK